MEEDKTITGDLILTSGTMDLNGHKLKVTGDVIQTGGIMKVNNGTLVIEGDYFIEYKTNENDVDIFKRSSGQLIMKNEKDYVQVKGSFEMGSIIDHSSLLTNGTLEIKKNLIQKFYECERNFTTNDNFKVLLSGNGQQKVNFARNNSECRIANLEITNESEEGIVIGENHVAVSKSLTDHGNKTSGYIVLLTGCQVTDNRFEGNIYVRNELHINQELTIGGNLTQYERTYLTNDITVEGDYCGGGNYLCMQGNNVTIKGNVSLFNTTVQLGGGRFTCLGNVTQEDSRYNTSGFEMNNDNDYVYSV